MRETVVVRGEDDNAGVPARRVSATLTVLTIRALVRQLPGGRFEALVRLS